jgi:hypothetical protein
LARLQSAAQKDALIVAIVQQPSRGCLVCHLNCSLAQSRQLMAAANSDPLWQAHLPISCHLFLNLPASSHQTPSLIFAGRIVCRFCLSGVVVSRRESSKNVEFDLDDGTDLVKCLIWSDTEQAASFYNRVGIGSMFEVRGVLHNFRGSRVMNVQSLSTLVEPDAVAESWLSGIAACSAVLNESLLKLNDQ